MTIGGIIVAIILGLIIGAIAKAIMPGNDPGGIIVTILLGIAGSVVGNLLAGFIFPRDANAPAGTGMFADVSLYGIILGIIGAIILLAIYRLATGRSMRG